MPEESVNQKLLENEVWQCLDSVHHLLKRREALNQTLRQGWMELTSARYALGPARISSALVSLKPHSPSVVVDVRASPSDLTGEDSASEWEEECNQMLNRKPVAFDLVKDRAEKEHKASLSQLDDLTIGEKKRVAQLRRRLNSTTPSDVEKDRWEIRSLSDDSGTESDDEATVAEAPKDTTQPLYWFGALVSPHLRSAQSSFSQALDLVVELANAQNEATHAHSNVLRLRRADNVVEVSSDNARQGDTEL